MDTILCWRCQTWVPYLMVDPMIASTDKHPSLCEDCVVERVQVVLEYRKTIRRLRAA